MNDQSNVPQSTLSKAMQAADAAVNHDANVEHLGALAVNATLEGMWVMHARSRMVGDDFKASRIIHRALVNLPAAKVEEFHTDLAPKEETKPAPVLKAMDQAANDAEAALQAAQ